MLQENSNVPIAYSRSGLNDEVMFGNIQEGVYSVYVKGEGTAPYTQVLNASAEDTLLGINGNITLIPDDQYFTLKINVADVYSRPVPHGNIRLYSEPDSLVFKTMSDANGITYISVDTSRTYKVIMDYYANSDSISGLSGSYGDTVIVDLLSICGEENNAIPSATILHQNYPNPFNPSTVIQFELSKAEFVELSVFDVSGRKVRTIVSKHYQPGIYQEVWDGNDDQGKATASGVYFYQFKAGGYLESRKLVLIR